MKVRKLGALVALALVAALTISSQTASANHAAMLNITVGAYLFDEDTGEGPPAESMRFFPENLTVHKGDTLTFRGDFHTATVLPTSVTDVDTWVAENASEPDHPHSFIKANPDNTTYPMKVFGDNPTSARTDCGSVSEPCSYIGDEVVDSGWLGMYLDVTQTPPVNNGFSVKVDANPGDVFWVICRVHPKMRLRVAVVNPNEDSSDQTEIDDFTNRTIREDKAAAAQLHENLSSTHASKRMGRRRVHTAWAGYDSDAFSLFAMYPRRIRLRKGDKVEWRFSALNHEVHTVTFSGRKAYRFAAAGQPFLCDPNGDLVSGGETMADEFPPDCGSATHELALSARLLGVVGDGVVKGKKDLENSGARGAGLSKDPYSLRFASGDKLKYICAIHPDMVGVIKFR